MAAMSPLEGGVIRPCPRGTGGAPPFIHLRSLAKPRRLAFRLATHALRVYLAFSMLGCAGSRPKPTPTEARAMETRTFEQTRGQIVNAALGALQDLGYTIDEVDSETGIVTASRQTLQPSGEITDESAPEGDDDGPPAWAIALMIVTGVILIMLIVAALTSDDKKDEKEKEKDKKSEPQHHDRHHGDHDRMALGFSSTVDPDRGPDFYQYRVTVRVQSPTEGPTQMRVSSQGAHYQDGRLVEAGPVNDPGFFQRFFAAMNESLRLDAAGESP